MEHLPLAPIRMMNNPRSKLCNMPLYAPIKQWKVTSKFGSRKHPTTGKTHFHNGVDLLAAVGTPVVAPTDGVLTYGWHKTGGWQAFITHPAGVRWTFAHLAAAPELDDGSFIKAGTEFARTGATGVVTGPHLHFGVKFKNETGSWDYQDPALIFSSK